MKKLLIAAAVLFCSLSTSQAEPPGDYNTNGKVLYFQLAQGIALENHQGETLYRPTPSFFEWKNNLIVSVPTTDLWWQFDGSSFQPMREAPDAATVFWIDKELLSEAARTAPFYQSLRAGKARCFECEISATAIKLLDKTLCSDQPVPTDLVEELCSLSWEELTEEQIGEIDAHCREIEIENYPLERQIRKQVVEKMWLRLL